MQPDLRLHEADFHQLAAAWESAIAPFADLAESLTTSQWQTASYLPGWTLGDIVAHVVGIERDLLGDPTPYSELEWSQLPHADDLFSRYTEIAVAARRHVPQDEVCAELRKTIAQRREALAAEPPDLAEIVSGPGGWQLPRGVALRIRCFDIWTHDQDIRSVVGRPGDLDTDAAWIAADRMVYGLARSWARQVRPPMGSAAAIEVTGPGVEFTVVLVLDDEGRGGFAPIGTPVTTTVRTSWPTYAALATGRPCELIGVEVTGDSDLGHALLENLNVAP